MKNVMVSACVLATMVGFSPDGFSATVRPVSGFVSTGVSPGGNLPDVFDGEIEVNEWFALGTFPPPSDPYVGPQTISFVFDGLFNISSFSLWNNAGPTASDGEGVDGFSLAFFDISSNLVGTFSGNALDELGEQIFAVVASNAAKVDLTVLSNHGRPYVMFHEISFEGTLVPIPASGLLFVTGLAALVRLRKTVQHKPA